MSFADLSNLRVIFTHSEVLAIVSVISKKFHFFSNVLKSEKEKLSFIIPDKIPLYWKGKVILYFTYPKNDVLKAVMPLLHEEYFSTSVQLLLDNTSITPLQDFISYSMGVCSVEDTQPLSYYITINQNITKKIPLFPLKIFKPNKFSTEIC